MSVKSIHQIIPGAGRYDAITAQARTFRRWLRQRGVESEIFAPHVEDDPQLGRQIRPLTAYNPHPDQPLIYHHSLGLTEIAHLAGRQPLVMVYHNITPADFFAVSDPAQAGRMSLGREQLAALRPHVRLAIGDSNYNLQELSALGYERLQVVPIAVDVDRFATAAPLEMERGIHLLFVGRIAPNKRQEDLIHLLAALQPLEPRSRLTLVGAAESDGYDRWLIDLAGRCGLIEHINRAGEVDDEELVDSFRQATVYVSMSEHEGFGKPLIESMAAGRPVVAFASAAVPETMGRAGILFSEKDFPALAELLLYLHRPENRPFIERLLGHQRARAAQFAPAVVQQAFYRALAGIEWLDHG